MQMELEIFKIFYRLNYSDFCFVYYHYNVITVLELQFSHLLSVKLTLRCILKCKKFCCYFLSLSTIRY